SRARLPPVIYTLSLHDALPICRAEQRQAVSRFPGGMDEFTHGASHGQCTWTRPADSGPAQGPVGHRNFLTPLMKRLPLAAVMARSEEHTSELQSRENLVCRLLL